MRTSIFVFLSILPLYACSNAEQSAANATEAASPQSAQAAAASAGTGCASGDTGITLPDGFCATVFADNLGELRHIAVDEHGDMYGILSSPEQGHGLVALRDTNGDGVADDTERFGDLHGSGLAIGNGWLYATTDTAVYRWQLPDEGLAPQGKPQRVVGGFPEQNQHAPKTIALDDDGNLYVNVGAPSNSCQQQDRTPGSMGQDPCPLLQDHGGIWAFDTGQTEQSASPGARYATGIRNAVAIAWNGAVNELYVVQHGRDQLQQLFPDLYDAKASAELPAEEMFRVGRGDNFGWPYCYYDQRRKEKVLAPEYGGDGEKTDRCDQYEKPIAAFPGHWAPNGLVFYSGEQFPEHYRGGAFVAFHGSWNRAPEPQEGYKVMFVPFEGALPSGDYEVFADGFSGQQSSQSPGNAAYRPMGLAVAPDGALYIGDTQKGRVWRVVYQAAP